MHVFIFDSFPHAMSLLVITQISLLDLVFLISFLSFASALNLRNFSVATGGPQYLQQVPAPGCQADG